MQRDHLLHGKCNAERRLLRDIYKTHLSRFFMYVRSCCTSLLALSTRLRGHLTKTTNTFPNCVLHSVHFSAVHSLCGALISTWVVLSQMAHCRFVRFQSGITNIRRAIAEIWQQLSPAIKFISLVFYFIIVPWKKRTYFHGFYSTLYLYIVALTAKWCTTFTVYRQIYTYMLLTREFRCRGI